MPEIWKWVPGYKGYYKVSDQGRVKSVDRTLTRKGSLDKNGRTMPDTTYVSKGKILALTPGGTMLYPYATLSKNGKARPWAVHQLVMLAFKGPPPKKGMEVCHKDGDVDNPRLTNLRYGTRTSNMADMIEHGTKAHGEKHGRASMTAETVREIRQLLALKTMSQNAIAARFGINFRIVSDIKTGRKWASTT